MPQASEIQALVPNVEILFNGRPNSAMLSDLTAFSVTEDLEAPSMFTLQLGNWDMTKGEVKWSDDKLFDIGTSIEIKVGYKPPLELLIMGEVTGLEPEFPENGFLSLVVRGHDLRHRLLLGTKMRSFTKMKDSDIFNQIAQEAGLQGDAQDTSVSLEYILQHNQTDLAFLQGRAERLGYEMTINRKILSFRPPQYTSSKVLTLMYTKDLLSFLPRLTAMGQVGVTEVRGADHNQKKALVGRAESSALTAMGEVLGLETAFRAFGAAKQVIGDYPVGSQAEVDQIAKGQMQNRALSYMTAEGKCIGNPQLQAGKVIEIAGVGRRFSGLYYVVATTHTVSLDEGYVTEFTARRNAA